MHEIETKVLDVDVVKVAKRLEELGATKVLDTRFSVDWFRPLGTQDNECPWFLRIRSDSSGKIEATWKSHRTFQGATSKHQEINLAINDHKALAKLFEAIGLEKYAHQEKNRLSWTYQDWRFDLDQYPNIPAWLEIEGKSEGHVQEALSLFELHNHRTTPEGEKKTIEEVYGVNWHSMVFD